MPSQKALLLNFREELSGTSNDLTILANYNMLSGLWENRYSVPLIEQFLQDMPGIYETTKTATREGSDQSDISNTINETTLTKTREGVDQSEVSCNGRLQTLITRSREGVDQSEQSISISSGTILTKSREGIDQSEVA